MRSTQTSASFPLAAVKPLDGLLAYRAHCLHATRRALEGACHRRERSPVTGARLEPAGAVEGIAYARCPETRSLFLRELPDPPRWAELLGEVSRHRHSPDAFHAGLAQSRTDHVHAPKLDWIHETLRLQGLRQPKLLEVVTPPSPLTPLFRDSGLFSQVETEEEMRLAHALPDDPGLAPAQVAVLLESLDRVDDPAALLAGVHRRLVSGGLLCVTALVCSGFDLEVLGLRNCYLYPPDRANCFSLQGLRRLLERAGYSLLEVSTPGVLDVEIVQAHLRREPSLDLLLSAFERQLLGAGEERGQAFQAFLQEQRLSSFARIVARREP